MTGGAFARLGDSEVIRGVVVLPRVGRWHARLDLDTEVMPSGAVTLSLAAGAVTLQGTVARGYVYAGRADVRVVAGANRLGAEIGPKAYRFVSAKIVLTELFADAGERLSETSDPAVTGAELQRWTRAGGPAVDALLELAGALGAAWRALPDGSYWVGLESWPESKSTAEVLDETPGEALLVLDAEDAAVWPGETLAGKRLSTVEHRIDEGSARTVVWVEDA